MNEIKQIKKTILDLTKLQHKLMDLSMNETSSALGKIILLAGPELHIKINEERVRGLKRKLPPGLRNLDASKEI